MEKKKAVEMAWKAFEESGDAGLFMLYSALAREEEGKEKEED